MKVTNDWHSFLTGFTHYGTQAMPKSIFQLLLLYLNINLPHGLAFSLTYTSWLLFSLLDYGIASKVSMMNVFSVSLLYNTDKFHDWRYSKLCLFFLCIYRVMRFFSKLIFKNTFCCKFFLHFFLFISRKTSTQKKISRKKLNKPEG